MGNFSNVQAFTAADSTGVVVDIVSKFGSGTATGEGTTTGTDLTAVTITSSDANFEVGEIVAITEQGGTGQCDAEVLTIS